MGNLYKKSNTLDMRFLEPCRSCVNVVLYDDKFCKENCSSHPCADIEEKKERENP